MVLAPMPTATPNAEPFVDGVAVAANDTVSDAVMLPAPYAFTVGVTVALPDAPALDLLDPPSHRRTTLVVAVRNEPGTLLAVLRVIADHDLNMRKLESRPSRERAWEYVFWIDLDGDVADPAMTAALDEVRGVTTMTRVLGSYPSPDA